MFLCSWKDFFNKSNLFKTNKIKDFAVQIIVAILSSIQLEELTIMHISANITSSEMVSDSVHVASKFTTDEKITLHKGT
jgi:hypothetical protein